MATAIGVAVTSIVVGAFVTWAVKLLNWVWFRPRKLEKFLRKQGLNGNSYRPFLGDVKDFIRATRAEQPKLIQLSDNILPHIFPHHMPKLSKYGKCSFMWFGPWPGLSISDPELVKEVLRNPNVFRKPYEETVKIFVGGLPSLEGEKWAKHRKIANPAFHLSKLKNMVPAMGLSCASMIHKWEAMVSKSKEGWCEVDVWPYLEDMAGDVISRTAFGSSHEEGTRIFQLQRDRFKLTLQVLPLSFYPGWRYLPFGVNRKLKAITKEIQSIVRGIIEKRRSAAIRGEAIPSDDLLGILMESNSRFVQENGNDRAGMSIEDVIDECRLFYFAGSDTTSSWLVWTMVLLCKHPEWQTRARAEIDCVLGKSEPTLEGLNRLKTVTMILQEVLRLYPPVPMTFRRSKQTVELGNLTIPAGVHLTLLIAQLHYDPQIWGQDANDFKPQRFSQGAAKMQSSFIPFSSGPRVCIGLNFAMTEAKMAIAMILQRFSFELSPAYLHAPFAVLTMSPQYGAPIILRTLSS